MRKIEQARQVLKALGLPKKQQNEISALTLLALLSLGPSDPWPAATRSRRTVSKDIMEFIRARYKKDYAPNTRETFRRQVLHQFVQAGVAEYNPFEPNLPTNSSRAHYAISEAALATIRVYGTPAWEDETARFKETCGTLAETYAGHRSAGKLVPLTLPDGREVELSPGKHNEVQKGVVEKFAPCFAPGATLLYIGDTAKKSVVMDKEAMEALGFSASDHDKLPDVVIYDRKRNWLFLVEAVTSHGPMSPKRVKELGEMLKGGGAGLIFVSAFPDMAEFRKHMKDIAWETEVWIAEMENHMIHFNGDRFLGPRK